MKPPAQAIAPSREHPGAGIYLAPGRLISIGLLLLATLALYYPVVRFEFLTYDDDVYILNDPAVQEFGWENLKTILFEPYIHAWYPLARLSAALDLYFFGHEAWGHHLVNAVLHFLNAAVLFLVLDTLGRRVLSRDTSSTAAVYTALFLGLLFAVHPQHVEAVCWVVQRKELLACLFSLAAVLFHLGRRSFATVSCLVLAMLAKPTAIVMSGLLLLLGVALLDPKQRNPARIRGMVGRLSPAIVVSLGMAVLVLINHDGLLGLNDRISPAARSALYADNALHGLSGFFSMQAGSIHQPIRDYVVSGSLLGRLSVLIVALLLGVSSVLLFSRQIAIRLAAFGLLFYFAALVPTGGLVLFGNYAFGDRYLYLSSAGLYIAVYAILLWLLQKHRDDIATRLTMAALVLWVAVAFLLSSRVLPRWETTWTVWKDNIERYPDSVLANYSLGDFYFQQKKFPLALRHFGMVVDSGSEKFLVAPRVSSALYMAEIFCRSGWESAAIAVLEKIPEFGGDLSSVGRLTSSLKASGQDACYEAIRRWCADRPGGNTRCTSLVP